jgi:hypothetical protein
MKLVASKRRVVGRNWDYFVKQGKLAWENSGGEIPHPPKDGSWQAKAWKEGFDKAYEKERPSLDLDHQEQVSERRSQFKVINGGGK